MFREIADAACNLSVDERLELIDRLWASLAPVEERLGHVLLTPSMKAELNRRIEELDANPDEGMTWEEFMTSWKSERSNVPTQTSIDSRIKPGSVPEKNRNGIALSRIVGFGTGVQI